jgi:hypothetical protein
LSKKTPDDVEHRASTISPSLDELNPFVVFLQVPTKYVVSTGRRYLWGVQQGHLGFPQLPSTFAMVAGWTRSNHICPHMFATQVFGPNMVNGQIAGMSSAVLAGILITAKDFPAGQFNLQARAMDHLIQTNDGGDGDILPDGLNITATVHDQISFPREDQANSAAGVADIDWLEICV